MVKPVPFKATGIQFNPKLSARDKNIEELFQAVWEAAGNGSKLIVTPEMATTGYTYEDREAISPFVDTLPGITTNRFEWIARQYGAYIVLGLPEHEPETGLYYNSAALVGPDGYIGKYRKMHLWATEENWACWGDLGLPVYPTEIGNIAMMICMDSIYFEASRLAAVQGADILAFPTNSSGQSIAYLQAWAETNGLYIVSANRSNTEKGYHMVGASAIWSPRGEKLKEADYLPSPKEAVEETTFVSAEIDPALYRNESKDRLRERRSALYKDLMLYVGPWDYGNKAPHRDIRAAALQYEPVPGDKPANLKKVEQLTRGSLHYLGSVPSVTKLLVLPELSFIGPVNHLNLEQIDGLAEGMKGTTVFEMQKLAHTHGCHIVFGLIEKEKGKLYNSAVIVTPEGKISGKYRKTHLGPSDRHWAVPGDQISVFSTEELGRIGLMIGYDAGFPEVAGVMAVKRAEIVAVPSAWCGDFSRTAEPGPAPAIKYPQGVLTAWSTIARSAQACTVVANFVGTTCGYGGRSAIFTLDHVQGLDQPVVASGKGEEVLWGHFPTIQSDSWFHQERVNRSRRTPFYKPLVYPMLSGTGGIGQGDFLSNGSA
ncbi:putative amidohydrolase [Melghirimyces profundicolus]|uniref:Putative amidohydrolase n=1 Tax=Melghirimyces profundicolus TaxID=1242148 RepID=A0A2T6C7V3_9BACL|nr:nitrilase-related carbon-nitrogen hydrolase [Melghirimyces profundicolus]PTX64397.1 putative amidohydrolase [Melghirimyces profundicolus]